MERRDVRHFYSTGETEAQTTGEPSPTRSPTGAGDARQEDTALLRDTWAPRGDDPAHRGPAPQEHRLRRERRPGQASARVSCRACRTATTGPRRKEAGEGRWRVPRGPDPAALPVNLSCLSVATTQEARAQPHGPRRKPTKRRPTPDSTGLAGHRGSTFLPGQLGRGQNGLRSWGSSPPMTPGLLKDRRAGELALRPHALQPRGRHHPLEVSEIGRSIQTSFWERKRASKRL